MVAISRVGFDKSADDADVWRHSFSWTSVIEQQSQTPAALSLLDSIELKDLSEGLSKSGIERD